MHQPTVLAAALLACFMTAWHRPVRVVPDPIRGAPHLLIMTEVLSPNGEPHPTNTRSQLAALIDEKVEKEAPLFGFEQEYTMLSKGTGVPCPQQLGLVPQLPFVLQASHSACLHLPAGPASSESVVQSATAVASRRAYVSPVTHSNISPASSPDRVPAGTGTCLFSMAARIGCCRASSRCLILVCCVLGCALAACRQCAGLA